jgi:hypothetical protein
MGCPGSMIPGFQQSEDIAKQNRGLSTKMDALVSSEEGKPKKTVRQVLPYVGTNEPLKNYIDYVNINDLEKLFDNYGSQYNKKQWSDLKNDIKSKGGLTEPIIINVNRKNRTAQIDEGHHRIKVAKELGYKYLPATVNMREGSTYKHKRKDIIPPEDNSLFHPHMIGDKLNPNWRPDSGKPSMYLEDLDIR